ncbi:MAG TPA: hypothetical protein VMR21_01845 [Vicinamibacteria bacterium]|nr:hypothetical protein [Vicinamibacteria bacterium]
MAHELLRQHAGTLEHYLEPLSGGEPGQEVQLELQLTVAGVRLGVELQNGHGR